MGDGGGVSVASALPVIRKKGSNSLENVRMTHQYASWLCVCYLKQPRLEVTYQQFNDIGSCIRVQVCMCVNGSLVSTFIMHPQLCFSLSPNVNYLE